jgi:hypothetical protein
LPLTCSDTIDDLPVRDPVGGTNAMASVLFLSQPPDKFDVMEAQAWTAIGLLAATLVGSLFYLGNRIDSLGARIDSLGARLDSRIDGLSGRIDGLTFRVEDQGRQLGSQIYELAAKLDDHLRRHAS